MINIAFKFHTYKRVDQTHQLQIRLRDKSREKIIPTQIYIDKRKWDNSNKMVRADHPAAAPINKHLKVYHDKIKKIKPLYELGEINFDSVYLILTSSGALDSIEDYRKNFCKRESAQWH